MENVRSMRVDSVAEMVCWNSVYRVVNAMDRFAKKEAENNAENKIRTEAIRRSNHCCIVEVFVINIKTERRSSWQT